MWILPQNSFDGSPSFPAKYRVILDEGAAEAEFLAPDGRWGVISVVLSFAYISIVSFAPTQNGSSGLRFTLVGVGVVWIAAGIRKIKAARAWKRHHLHKT